MLELSRREAVRLGDNHIGTGHILLALTEDAEGGVAKVLARLGADPMTIRRRVMLRMQAQRKDPGA